MIYLMLFLQAALASQADSCRVCIMTPQEVTSLSHGKKASFVGHDSERIEKLAKPLFAPPLTYSIDDGQKLDLPPEGVFLRVSKKGSHVLRIYSAGKNQAKTSFSCDEYPTGVKVEFESASIGGAGWHNYSFPSKPTNCPAYSSEKDAD